MKVLRLNSERATHGWRTGLGALVLVGSVAIANSAAAEPKSHEDHNVASKAKAGKGDPQEQRGAVREKRGAARDERGAGHEEHPGMMPGHEHEREAMGDGGVPHAHGKRIPFAHRKQRLAELKAKQDAGTLVATDQAEFEHLQRVQARIDALDAKHKAEAESRKIRSREHKRKAVQEAPKVGHDVNTNAEYTKHAERLAKLDRAKDLATATEDTELVPKLESLIAKEEQRHQAWVSKNSATSQGAAQ